WPVVRYAAGRCPDRDCAIARAAVRHRATVRRARCAIEFRADHAIGARPQQARRRLSNFHPFAKCAGGLLKSINEDSAMKIWETNNETLRLDRAESAHCPHVHGGEGHRNLQAERRPARRRKPASGASEAQSAWPDADA